MWLPPFFHSHTHSFSLISTLYLFFLFYTIYNCPAACPTNRTANCPAYRFKPPNVVRATAYASIRYRATSRYTNRTAGCPTDCPAACPTNRTAPGSRPGIGNYAIEHQAITPRLRHKDNTFCTACGYIYVRKTAHRRG